MYNKLFVIFTLNWIAVSWGFLQGQVASMIGALHKQDEGIILSEDEISLIAAFLSLCCIFGVAYLAVLGEKFGRRWCFVICSMPLVINWLILYYARTFAALMISRFLAGLTSGSIRVLSAIGAAEYTSQESRGLFIGIVSMVTPAFGIGLAHVLGVMFHWRTLALIGMALSIVSVILPYFLVESPHWLALKGRFDECERTFRKLHGTNPSSEHELQLLIKTETSKQKAALETNTNHTFGQVSLAIRKKYFWNLILTAGFLYAYYAAAGKAIFTNFATTILEEMMGTSDVLWYTFVVDGFIFLGTCIACILIKKTSMRVLLFSSGLTANGILIALSACLYFKNSEIYFRWINVMLLALYFIVIHAGPYPVMDILLGELFPLELKLYCFLFVSPFIIATIFLCVLLMPYIVAVIGYHGLFLLNTAIMFVCLAFFYVKIPETKGKTLQEIEVYLKTNNFDVDEILSSDKQTKALI